MARLSSLSYINFTAGASSNPTTTKIGTLITSYYKKCYNHLYGHNTYSVDESTDKYGIIDTDEFRDKLDELVSHKAQLWNESGKNSDGTVRPMPIFDLYYDDKDEERRNQFINFLNTAKETDDNVDYIDNVRLYGSDYSDRSGVLY